LYDDHKIADKIVSWSIVSDEQEPSTNKSDVKFGAGMTDAYNGNLFSHKSSNNSWALNFTGLYYNYDAVNANQTKSSAYLDTGNNFAMQVDDASWDTLSATFEAAGFNCSSGPCVSQSNCSDLYSGIIGMNYIKVVIDDSAYWIPPAGYTYRTQSLTNDTCMVAIEKGA